MKKSLLILSILILNSLLTAQVTGVRTGADVLLSDSLHLIQNKNIAVITNHTAILSGGQHLIDALLNIPEVHVKALFGPEHGIRGNAPDGKSIDNSKLKNIPVFSLYGDIRKPTAEMLKGIEILIFDIQDIGSRYYTFISTMYNCLEAAGEFNIPIIILDRPNPINGFTVDGPLINENYKSFVATAPVPIVHGMTIGELAVLFNNEFLDTTKKAEVIVVKMQNWDREFYFDDCGLKWVKPSPNMPDLETALLYPGLCLLEGINISEGRGTFEPFKQIGAPYIDSKLLVGKLNELNFPGIEISEAEFTPVSIDSMSSSPKYLDQKCYGVKFKIVNRDQFNALRFGINLVSILYETFPDKFEFRRNWIDKLYGSDTLSTDLKNHIKPEEIIHSWQNELDNFQNLRQKYLLY